MISVIIWRIHSKHKRYIFLVLFLLAIILRDFLVTGVIIGFISFFGSDALIEYRKERKKGHKRRVIENVIVSVQCPHCYKSWKINTLENPKYLGNVQECEHCKEIFVPRRPGIDEYFCKDCKHLWKISIGDPEPYKCPRCKSPRIENYTKDISDIILEEKRKKMKKKRNKKYNAVI